MTDNETGSIIIDSVPKGLPVRLDGERVSEKTTPAVLENVPAGKHIIEVDLPDECNFSREVRVYPGSNARV